MDGIPFVLFVAPLPPPVNGLSEISARMLERLRAKVRVEVFNSGPAGICGGVNLLSRFLRSLVSSRARSLYMTLSGGRRQWFELIFLLAANLRGMSVYIHHHSFAYLDQRTLRARLFLFFARQQTHVVLCSCMARKLRDGYKITKLRVISNAALTWMPHPGPKRPHGGGQLRIGFLSNITAEKGIFEYFEVLAAAQEAGLPVEGVIGGPVDKGIESSFASALRLAGTKTSYIGPVYGSQKEALLRTIDILFFPTRYRNEAEPVTILEALSCGVPVMAFGRGCIGEMLHAGAGWVVDSTPGAYLGDCVSLLADLALHRARISEASVQATIAFNDMRSRYAESLSSVVAEIAEEGCAL